MILTLARKMRRDEDGVAMVMMIGVSALLAALVVVGIAYSTGSLRAARNSQDWNAALAAAYAGVDEYESRLANDTGYFRYGNPAADFSSSSTRLILPPGGSVNPAFGIGTDGTWATVPGSEGTAQFRYEVDNSQYWVDGTLRVRSTGRVGEETRTVVADLRQKGFIDFLYFTDYETSDPTASNPGSNVDCAIHYPDRPSYCQQIFFGGMDVINGPLHTNDAIHTNGRAVFNGKVTTRYQAASGPNYIRASGTAPVFRLPGDPESAGTIGMPATNSELRKETRFDLPDEVPSPGCLYTGPTKITFHSNGEMTVVSPWTKFTNTSGEAATSGRNPAYCGQPGTSGLARTTGSGTNRRYVGQRLAVPANTVIFVQNVPEDGSNVNRTPNRTPPYGGVTCQSNGNAIGYPLSNEELPFSQAYGCRNGDAFVEGTLDGAVTVAAENYIYVTDDIRYADDPSDGSSDDYLGLIGQNAVWVHNPMERSCNWWGSCSSAPMLGQNRTIHAAILSVAHTFMVQNYTTGGRRGTLTVYGAIAQRFRGPVGNGSGASISNGYAKDYTYDERFRRSAPPKFLNPVTTNYGVTVWVETAPAMDANGAYR